MKRYLTVLATLIIVVKASAVTKTWVGTTTTWATGSNWSPNGVPGAGDDVVFNNTKNCSINTTVGVNSITLSINYTGTVSRPNNTTSRPVTINNFSCAGGTFNLSANSSNGAVTVNNNTVISGGFVDYGTTASSVGLVSIIGGTFRLASALSVNNDFILNAGTYNPQGNSVQYSGSLIRTGGTLNTSLSGATFFGDNTTVSGGFSFNTVSFSSGGSNDVSFYIVGGIFANSLSFDPNDFTINIYRDPIYLQTDFDASSSSNIQTAGTVISNNLFIFNGSLPQSVNLVSDEASGYFFSVGGLQFNNTASGVTFTSSVNGTNLIGGITILGGSLDDGGNDITLPANQNFQINNGASFISSSATLPSFSGSGTFISPSSYTVTLTGGLSQTISSPYSNFNHLIINKPIAGDVTISTPTSITGFLNISNLSGSNKLNTNGNLTLVSNATQTASLIDFSAAGSGGSVNGNLTIQRFSVGTTNAGHYYSSPIANAAFSVITQVGTGYPILMYSEDGNPARLNMNFSGAYRNVTSSNLSIMTPGRGFSTGQLTNKTIQFVGVPNNGNVTYNITYNTTVPGSVAGWNMIGNPYPSAIDWGSVDKVGGINTAYLYSISGYVTLVNAPNNIIPSGQGFFVRATSSAPLVFKNADRVSNITSTGNNIFYRKAEFPRYLYLDLESKIIGLNSKDAAIFSFKSDAGDGLDQYDSEKIFNPSPLANVYTQIDGKSLVVNVMNNSSFNKVIPIYVSVRTAGTYQFSLRNLSDFYNNVKVFLHDTQNPNSPVELTSDFKYSFDYSTFTGSRFKISFVENNVTEPTTLAGVDTTVGENLLILNRTFILREADVDNTTHNIEEVDNESDFKSYGYDNKLKIVSINENVKSIDELYVYDVIGNTILLDKNAKFFDNVASFDIPKAGIYIVKCISNGKIHINKIIL